MRQAASRGWRVAVNQATQSGATPLYIACEMGQHECVRLLLEAGAAVDQAPNDGTTPLFVACQNNHLECARLLLAVGASVAQAADNGATPLYIACQKPAGVRQAPSRGRRARRSTKPTP